MTVSTIDRSETWMGPFIKYLQKNILPDNERDAKLLLKKASGLNFMKAHSTKNYILINEQRMMNNEQG